jgi:acyl-coenzyme A thioesterase PaaI-like protein
MPQRPTLDSTRLASELLGPVPAIRSFGIEVLHAAHGSSELCMLVPDVMTGLVGSLHSSGLTALADATGHAALISAATDEAQLDDVFPLCSSARIDLIGPAYGLLVGRCSVGVDGLGALEPFYRRRRSRVQLMTDTEIFDSEETLVCRGTCVWTVSRGG